MTQATVRSWDPADGGSAFLDDGTVVVLPAECLVGSVFRFLRPGQRVALMTEAGRILSVRLP